MRSETGKGGEREREEWKRELSVFHPLCVSSSLPRQTVDTSASLDR
jgi:hypothetical protein